MNDHEKEKVKQITYLPTLRACDEKMLRNATFYA